MDLSWSDADSQSLAFWTGGRGQGRYVQFPFLVSEAEREELERLRKQLHIRDIGSSLRAGINALKLLNAENPAVLQTLLESWGLGKKA